MKPQSLDISSFVAGLVAGCMLCALITFFMVCGLLAYNAHKKRKEDKALLKKQDQWLDARFPQKHKDAFSCLLILLCVFLFASCSKQKNCHVCRITTITDCGIYPCHGERVDSIALCGVSDEEVRAYERANTWKQIDTSNIVWTSTELITACR